MVDVLRPYAGVGSRKLPYGEVPKLRNVATQLERRGFKLRSGGARGSDTAFESGVSDPAHKEIYLPFQDFNEHASPLFDVCPAALEMAARFHPRWSELGEFARLAHGRNCYQVLGPDLATPSLFVVCWTPGGQTTGGTAQAMRIAWAHLIPVFNLAQPDALRELAAYVRTI